MKFLDDLGYRYLVWRGLIPADDLVEEPSTPVDRVILQASTLTADPPERDVFGDEMTWVIEIFEPEMQDPEYFEDLIADAPLLYGPHDDSITAMEMLDKVLGDLNADAAGFTGRIRPMFTSTR